MQKGFTPILLLAVVLVIALIAGGIYFWFVRCPNGTIETGSGCRGMGLILPSPFPKPISNSSPTTETASWKTYTNTKYAYQVKYPPTWSANEVSHSLSLLPPNQNENDFNGNIGISVEEGSFAVKTDTDAKKEFQLFMDSCSPEAPTSCTEKTSDLYKFEKQITVGGKVAFQTIGGCCRDIGRHIFVYNNNYQYRITLYVDSLDERPSKLKNEDTFNQILSTFTFLDQEQSVVSPKQCKTDDDCVTVACMGCVNNEASKIVPPDSVCPNYQYYSCKCINNRCSEMK